MQKVICTDVTAYNNDIVCKADMYIENLIF